MNQLVDAAYRALPLCDHAKHRLPGMVDVVSRLLPRAPLPKFSKISPASAEKEMKEFLKKVEELLDCLEGQHRNSIDALASVGFVNDRHRLVNLLKVAKEAAHSPNLSFGDEYDARGRKPHLLAKGLSRILASDYSVLTGKRPTVTTDPYSRGHPAGGEFLKFVQAVFLALDINASAETWARSAAEARGNTAKEKKPA